MLLVLALLLSFVFQTKVYAFFGLAGVASVVLVYNEMRKSGESG